MSNISRKFKRKNAAKNKKQTKKQLKEQISNLNKMGNKCIFCEAPYDRTNSEHLDSFRVSIKGNDIKLCCGDCWEKRPGNL
jgi:predicted peroxiredoxin